MAVRLLNRFSQKVPRMASVSIVGGFILLLLIAFFLISQDLAAEDKLPFNKGDAAPSFAVKDSEGKTYKSEELYKTGPVLLIFYPGDETPGCTKQLCAVRDDYAMFAEHGILPFGVNNADAESHNRFIEKQDFQFPIFVDEGFKVSKAIGAYKNGDPHITRTVVLVGKGGKILFYERGMPEHSAIMNAFHESMGGECPVCAAAAESAQGAASTAGSGSANETGCSCGAGCGCGGNPCKCHG